MSPDIQGAMLAAKAVPVQAPHATVDPVAAKKLATQFEGTFVSEFLGQMFEGIPTDGEFGGGEGEEMFRSLLTDEYGKQIESSGGFGLSAAIQRQLLQTQEARP
jgi:Rod binding domain-containing protein